MGSLTVFLPQASTRDLQDLAILRSSAEQLEIKPLIRDWQEDFSERVDYPASRLPWTQLLTQQFQIPSEARSACSCQPVMMQLTHRGAYMVGQADLQLNPNDAIRIVTRINEELVGEGECFYLIDRFNWLFTSDKTLKLGAPAVTDLIGKDVFNHHYDGKDADYWRQLSTEVQMMIKQMIDYNQLPQVSPEMMLNVHFSDLIDLQSKADMPFIQNDNLCVISDNEIIQSFCKTTFVKYYSLDQLDSISHRDKVLLAFDSERECYPDVVKYWLEKTLNDRPSSSTIFCQDSQIRIKPAQNWFKKIFSRA